MKSNPYVLGLLIILSALLFVKEKKPLVGIARSANLIRLPKAVLEIGPLILKDSFHAHEFDSTARSVRLIGPKKSPIKCSYNNEKTYGPCEVGETISWSASAYKKGFALFVKNFAGIKLKFTPKKYNPNLSFHRCDRFLRKGSNEKTLRKSIKTIKDRNHDGMRILCLDKKQIFYLNNGPLVLKKDLAIIGTHSETPVIKSMGNFPVFKNENKTLFLYNLKLVSSSKGSHGISLGVGSYLGADNLNITLISSGSEGIHCFGCTIDGDRVKIKALASNSKAIFSSLGLLEFRWANLVVNGQNSSALKTEMGSFTNILENSILESNNTGPVIEMIESGLFFSTGTVNQNGSGAAIYITDLDNYISELNGLEINAKSIGIMIKNAKNVFLKDIVINSGGARMVNLGPNRVSQN